MSDASIPHCPGCDRPESDCNCRDRLDAIAKSLGLKGLEDITCEPNAGAPDGSGYSWGAWVGEFDFNSKVGTGDTPEAAIEDLLDQLSQSDADPGGPGAYDLLRLQTRLEK